MVVFIICVLILIICVLKILVDLFDGKKDFKKTGVKSSYNTKNGCATWFRLTFIVISVVVISVVVIFFIGIADILIYGL